MYSSKVLRYTIAVIVSIIAVTIIITVASFLMPAHGGNILATPSASSSNEARLTMASGSENSLVGQSKYFNSSDLFGNILYYAIQDGEIVDQDGIPGVAQDWNVADSRYSTVRQVEAYSQYQTDRVSKIVEITDHNGKGIATLNHVGMQEVGGGQGQLQNRTTPIRNLTYYVKFECGTISGNEGPLRPGHYDTDIGILNKQDSATQIQWSITANDSINTNSIVRTLEPQGSINIVCKDLRNILGNDQRFVEGFVIIYVPLEPGLLGSLSHGTQVIGRNFEATNSFIEVQAFYTANALDQLPSSVFVDKITFRILNDASGKIPIEVMNKTLDVTVPSGLNQISDPEIKVKDLLAARYGLSTQERINLQIMIENVTGSVGSMIDDHAISLSTVMPQASR